LEPTDIGNTAGTTGCAATTELTTVPYHGVTDDIEETTMAALAGSVAAIDAARNAGRSR